MLSRLAPRRLLASIVKAKRAVQVKTRRAGIGWVVLVTTVIVATAMRFYRPDEAPPGFYRDEAAIAAQVFCLAESGRNLQGEHWPFMSPVLGGGYSTIAWQAPAVTWSKVAGSSIAAMRSFAAVCGALTVAGVFFLGLFATGSRRVGAYSALSIAISPWAFQLSRVAWDPAIAPLYLTWALAWLAYASATTSDTEEARVAQRRRLGWIAVVASAVLFAAACISYPPLRVEVPLVMLGFLAWKRSYVRAHLHQAAVFSVTFALCTAQLWLLTRSGQIQGRFESLSVFSASHWAEEGVDSRGAILLHGAWLFVTNFFAHFTPTYLLGSGDGNLRHSTQAFGEWSWLDAIGLVSGAVVALRSRRTPTRWVGFALFGYFAGIVPAALTWEGIPHALRSIGALPFLALLVGTAIDAVANEAPRQPRRTPLFAGLIALVFSATFWPVFFIDYPSRATHAFDAAVERRLEDPGIARRLVESEGDGHPPADETQAYPLMALRYYQLRAGAVHCAPSGPVLVQ